MLAIVVVSTVLFVWIFDYYAILIQAESSDRRTLRCLKRVILEKRYFRYSRVALFLLPLVAAMALMMQGNELVLICLAVLSFLVVVVYIVLLAVAVPKSKCSNS
jgi:hypothetical protein